MSQEVELKLALSEEAVTQFLSLQWFHSYPTNKRQPDKVLENIYFDTPDLQLLKARAALRIRRSGNEYLQTLKTKGTSVGGLHQRGEWEYKIAEHSDEPGFQPQLQTGLFPAKVWPSELDVEKLVPVFETNFVRACWLWRSSKGSTIEVVLDRGDVIAGQTRSGISELELELLEGSPECVFDLAEALSKSVPMLVSDVTKAQRGFELFRPGAWQTSVFSLAEAETTQRELEWVIQTLMSPVQDGSDLFPSVCEALVESKVLDAMDVTPWLLLGDIKEFSPLLRGQWLLRLARYAWRNAQLSER